MDEQLDKILDIDPAATRTATCSPLDMPAAAGPGGVILDAVVVIDAANTEALAARVEASAPAILPDKQIEELEQDMEYARVNVKDVIDQAKASLSQALELAETGGEARHFEVASQMITAIVDANKTLISLHKTRKDTLKTDKEVKGTGEASPQEIHINQAVFVGRASDLLRKLKEIEKEHA
jgi:hypothetical protein